MRTLGTLALAALVVGCGGGTTSTADMAMTGGGDMAMGGADIAMAGGDMASQADLMPAKVFSGTGVFVDVSAKVPVPDMGLVPARLLAPLLGFGDGSGKSDFDNRDVLGLGCTANHYDMSKMDNPTVGLDGGKVTVTGIKASKLLNGMTGPTSAECTFEMGAYKCLLGGMAMLNVDTTPFQASETPLEPGKTIKFVGAGSTNFGTFDSGDISVADEPMTITNPGGMEGLRFVEGKDLEITFFCKGGSAMDSKCESTALAFSVSFSQAEPQNYGAATPTSGNITCASIAAQGKVTVPKEAIGAAIAGDTLLKSQRITMVRIGLPTAKMDTKGQTIRFAAGRGAGAITPIK